MHMKRNKRQILVNVKRLPKNKREELRSQAFAEYKVGTTAYATAKKLRVNVSCVYHWFDRFGKEGESVIEERPRGPSEMQGCRLEKEEMDELLGAVTRSTPDQLMFDFALWSSRAVVAYVKKHFKKDICRRTARRYLQRLGFTFQSPVRRAREQNPAAVAQWLETSYPQIKAEAKANGATILWGDETTVQVGGIRPRGYSPRGVSPVLRTTANRSIKCNMISAVGNRGDLVFMTFRDAMNVDTFKAFVTKLIAEFECPLTLIVDNLRVHHAKCLDDWFAERRKNDGVRIEYLPSYSPELNPDEYLNRDLKAGLAEKALTKDLDGVNAAVVEHLTKQKNDPAAVRRLFGKPEVRYAAAEEAEAEDTVEKTAEM
jgi:transposase